MQNSAVLIAGLLLNHVLTVTTCPDQCGCTGNTLTCVRSDIPLETEIPLNISSVYVTNFNFENLNAGTFNHTKWENVTFLDLHAEEGTILRGGVFTGLKNLEYLGLHGDNLRVTQASVFEGIDKVHTLNLSNNYHLDLEDLVPTWDRRNRNVLPSLETLILSELNALQAEPLTFEREFMRSVSFDRLLKYLDISNTNIAVLDFNHVYLLCKSVEHFVIRNAGLAYPKGFYHAPNCASLRTLDISDTVLQVASKPLTFEAAHFTCTATNVYNSIENLIISGTLASETDISFYHLDLTDCGFQMKKITARRNNVRWFNVTVSLSERLKSSVSELDFSENGLEFIAPESIYPSENLQILRLSKNRLHTMQSNYWADFARLLRRSRKLREFFIAENELVTIPRKFFENNQNLEHIDMSRNQLQSLDFDISHLMYLHYLDLSWNWIKTIDRSMHLKIDDLSRYIDAFKANQSSSTKNILSQQTSTSGDITMQVNGSVPLQVNVGFNPYDCSCNQESHLSTEWLKTSTAVDRKNTTYICNFQRESLDIMSSATEVIETECAHQTLMKILKISIPLAVAAIASVIITVMTLRRRQRIKRRYQNFLNDLGNGRFDKTFLAFLSYCSEDTDFVMEHIYSQLQDALSEETGIDKNFVCTGDREFHLGLPVHAEVMRCIEDCSVVMFIVSKTFCKKGWCQTEVGEAYDQRKPIVMVMREFVEVDEMPKVLGRIFNRYTRALWVNDDNGGHLEPDMKIISKSIIDLARKNKKNDICPDQDV